MRVVLDTNVIISAQISDGLCRTIFLNTLGGAETVLITSPILLIELQEKLIKKFSYSIQVAELLIQKLKKVSLVVNPIIEISILSDGPDNRVLEAAITAACDCIVTGDKAFLKLEKFQKIAIVSPRQFLTLHHD